MKFQLPLLDWIVLIGYFVGILLVGLSFYRRTRTSDQFTAAGRSLPGWLCGLSIFATYVSSISYLGIPGKAFAGNWNPLVASLALPLAAALAVAFFLPYYRGKGYVSAYAMLEDRFGLWARLYASTLYLLLQIARMGVVMYLMALPMAVIFGWDMRTIILITGVVVTFYSWLGGIVAVIWTDAIQAIVLLVGILVAGYYVLDGVPGGWMQVVQTGIEESKFSLGSFSWTDWTSATFWVVLTYGFCENLRNFAIDQSYIQRYIAAGSDSEGRRSIYLGALTYLPVAAMFLFLGTSFSVFYNLHADELPAVKAIVLRQRAMQAGEATEGVDFLALAHSSAGESIELARVADQVFPHFIATHLPQGVTGLLIAAIFAAAMSTVSTSLNSSATLVMSDFYQRFRRHKPGDRELMYVLHLATACWGLFGTLLALALIRYTDSALDMWWKLSSVIGAGLVGLFLAGLVFPSLSNRQAVCLVVLETLIVGYMTLSQTDYFPSQWESYRSPLHPFLAIVIGTLVILLGAALCVAVGGRKQDSHGASS